MCTNVHVYLSVDPCKAVKVILLNEMLRCYDINFKSCYIQSFDRAQREKKMEQLDIDISE